MEDHVIALQRIIKSRGLLALAEIEDLEIPLTIEYRHAIDRIIFDDMPLNSLLTIKDAPSASDLCSIEMTLKKISKFGDSLTIDERL